VLLFDERGVAGERASDLEVLALDDALRARDLPADHRAVDGRVGPVIDGSVLATTIAAVP
jgi:hypothetical protein